MNLSHYLTYHNADDDLARIITSIANASIAIHARITLTETHKSGADNATGDTQSPLDITSDEILYDHLAETHLVRTVASEERARLVDIKDAQKDFFVAYDPYDGGSVGDANITFGSIVGIWSQSPLGRSVGMHLLSGCLALYGPRTTLIVGLPDIAPACFEYDLQKGQFILISEDIHVAPTAKHFAPGNLTACNDNLAYKLCVDQWIGDGLKLRYSGALVTDVNHILMKGDGIFTYPADKSHPTGRLRLLYEAGPIGHILERAGGVALTQNGERLLDQVITDPHERISFFMGSRETINDAVETMNA